MTQTSKQHFAVFFNSKNPKHNTSISVYQYRRIAVYKKTKFADLIRDQLKHRFALSSIWPGPSVLVALLRRFASTVVSSSQQMPLAKASGPLGHLELSAPILEVK